MSAGTKIIDGLKDAIAGNVARVTIEGQTWVRAPYGYAHMCRDDHEQIGHNDSEHEQCPLCRLRAMIEDACKVFEHYDLPEHAFHYRRALELPAAKR